MFRCSSLADTLGRAELVLRLPSELEKVGKRNVQNMLRCDDKCMDDFGKLSQSHPVSGAAFRQSCNSAMTFLPVTTPLRAVILFIGKT